MQKRDDKLRQTVFAITQWVGSPQSVAVHTVAFVASFTAVIGGFVELDRMLLVLTTIVSLEAIYLSLFIQMTVNFQGQSLEEVEQDINEIQEDIDEIQEDVDEIAEDVDEIAEDVEEMQEDVSEMSEEDKQEEAREKAADHALEDIRTTLAKLMQDLERLQTKK